MESKSKRTYVIEDDDGHERDVRVVYGTERGNQITVEDIETGERFEVPRSWLPHDISN